MSYATHTPPTFTHLLKAPHCMLHVLLGLQLSLPKILKSQWPSTFFDVKALLRAFVRIMCARAEIEEPMSTMSES